MSLPTAQLATMRRSALALMHDTCTIQARSATLDAHGQETATYGTAVTSACGFDPAASRRRQAVSQGQEVTLISDDPVLRLPLGVTVDHGDKVTITHVSGEALSPTKVFYVYGPVRRGRLTLVMDLHRVET